MKMRKAVLLAAFFLMGAVSAFALPEEANQQFQKANQFYKQGKFKEAAPLYESLADKYPQNASVQFNLGNAYHRLGKTGLAILSYEKALYLNPRDNDARANLNYLRGSLEYKIEDKRNFYLRLGERALQFFTESELMLTVLGLLFLLLASSVFVLFFKTDLTFGPVRKTVLVLFLLSLIFITAKNVQAHFIRPAVVTVKEAPVRYGPSGSDQVAFRLKEGLKVYVLDHGEDWSRVVLTNKDTGWIENAHIAEIRS